MQQADNVYFIFYMDPCFLFLNARIKNIIFNKGSINN